MKSVHMLCVNPTPITFTFEKCVYASSNPLKNGQDVHICIPIARFDWTSRCWLIGGPPDVVHGELRGRVICLKPHSEFMAEIIFAFQLIFLAIMLHKMLYAMLCIRITII